MFFKQSKNIFYLLGVYYKCSMQLLPVETRQIPALWSFEQAFSSSCEAVWTPGSFPPARMLGHSLTFASVQTKRRVVKTKRIRFRLKEEEQQG